jgi:undecaprenyl-diphosphatase
MEFLLILKVITLGIVEGLTEYLPVSSTGHLIIIGDKLKFDEIPDKIFETSIQFGAILAVIILYRVRIKNIILNFYKDSPEQKITINLILAFMPAAIIGLLLHGFIKEYLFTVKIVALSLILGGIIMIIIDKLNIQRETKKLENISLKQALSIGFFQCIAMIPGVSRSGATIVGGVLIGLTRKNAAEFSFFLAIPTIFAASVYDIVKHYHLLTLEHLNLILIGFVTSFISAFIVVSRFIGIIQRYGFMPFGIYRVILGCIIILTV